MPRKGNEQAARLFLSVVCAMKLKQAIIYIICFWLGVFFCIWYVYETDRDMASKNAYGKELINEQEPERIYVTVNGQKYEIPYCSLRDGELNSPDICEYDYCIAHLAEPNDGKIYKCESCSGVTDNLEIFMMHNCYNIITGERELPPEL